MRCGTGAGIRAARSAGFHLLFGFGSSIGCRRLFQIEDLFQFPPTCEFLAVLFLLFLLQMNYLSDPQSVHPHGFHCDSLRKIAAPLPRPCVPSPQPCGPFARLSHSQGALLASVSSPSKSARLRRLAPLQWRRTRSVATRSSSAPAFAG